MPDSTHTCLPVWTHTCLPMYIHFCSCTQVCLCTNNCSVTHMPSMDTHICLPMNTHVHNVRMCLPWYTNTSHVPGMLPTFQHPGPNHVAFRGTDTCHPPASTGASLRERAITQHSWERGWYKVVSGQGKSRSPACAAATAELGSQQENPSLRPSLSEPLITRPSSAPPWTAARPSSRASCAGVHAMERTFP